MKKISKSERLNIITKILTSSPNKVFNLNYFAGKFDCAKSTLSEDIDSIRKLFAKFELGDIETIAGAGGGIKYKPIISQEEINNFCNDLCLKILFNVK